LKMLPVVLCGKNSYGNQVNWKSFLSEVTRAPTVKPTRSLKRYSTWAKAAYDLVKSSYGDCVDGIPPASRPALAGAWTKSFPNGRVYFAVRPPPLSFVKPLMLSRITNGPLFGSPEALQPGQVP